MFEGLTKQAEKILHQEFSQEGIAVTWVVSRDADRGDASTSLALQLAKKLGKNPHDIARILVEGLQSFADVESAEVAGAGYVNVRLTPKALLEELKLTRQSHTKKVKTQSKCKHPVIIDFCGPNIAKPLGAHHLGSHIIGQAIINIYKHEGFPTIGWTYPGDWGTQFGKLAVAFRRWGDAGKPLGTYSVEELLALYVRFHEEAEKDSALEDEARAAFGKIEGGDPELRTFWEQVVKISREALEKIYKRLHIAIDVETGESFYEDKMQPILEEGLAKNIFKEGEKGALIVPFSEESGLPPLMVRKSDGSTLYATRDLAMIRYRIDSYHPSALYYVVDIAQSLHFKQLEATCRLLEWDLPVFEHTLFGRMRFENTSMSTRKGTSIRMEELLDEGVRRAEKIIEERGESIQSDDPKALAEMMGTGAIAYGILSQNRKMDIVFDWDKMLSFEGNSAPYLQYTHARTQSLLRKASQEGTQSYEFPAGVSFSEMDRLLLKSLLLFTAVLDDARETRMPHKLANYLFQLAQDFNAFYNKEPILKAEGESRDVRLALTAETASTLRTGAELLTLRLPDRM